MTRALMASIERKCPCCGAVNRIMTNEIRPHWRINCSNCGAAVAELRGFRPYLVRETVVETGEPGRPG